MSQNNSWLCKQWGYSDLLQPEILAIQYLQVLYTCALNTYICACTSIYMFILRWDEWYTNANPLFRKSHFLTFRKKQMACLNNLSEMAWLLNYLASRARFGYVLSSEILFMSCISIIFSMKVTEFVLAISCFKERSYSLSGFVWC